MKDHQKGKETMKKWKEERLRLITIALILACGSFIVGGCSKRPSGGTSSVVNYEGGIIETFPQTSWPKDIPAEIPVFTFGKIKAVTKDSLPTGAHWSLRISELLNSAIDSYYEQLTLKQWYAIAMPLPKGRVLLGNEKDFFIYLITYKDNTALLIVSHKPGS